MDIKWNELTSLAIEYGTKIIGAVFIFIVGWWFINRLVKGFGRLMQKRELDVTLRPTLKSVLKIGLRILLIISVASMIGVKMTSFIAVLGAAGLAVGMALQGSLANFAGGILLLILKPIEKGDFISAGSVSGTVREIQIFHTFLTTMNKQEIIIPNGKLANDTITNYSRHAIRGLGMEFQVGYANSIDKVKQVLDDIIQSTPGLVQDPAPYTLVKELKEDYVSFTIQAWFESDKFWPAHNNLPERVKKQFDQEEIRIPHPIIRNIHLLKEDA